jgi:hypothetical protein
VTTVLTIYSILRQRKISISNLPLQGLANTQTPTPSPNTPTIQDRPAKTAPSPHSHSHCPNGPNNQTAIESRHAQTKQIITLTVILKRPTNLTDYTTNSKHTHRIIKANQRPTL